jgi:hypothetical protein
MDSAPKRTFYTFWGNPMTESRYWLLEALGERRLLGQLDQEIFNGTVSFQRVYAAQSKECG